MNIKSVVKLNNGKSIPLVGLGVYKIPQNVTKQAVLWALEAGYRHIDTAKMYGNERQVGEAIKESGVSREDVFVTTKLWNSDQGYKRALSAFEGSLKALDLDYVDLYLLHWPVGRLRSESWKALQEILNEGECKSIGVSNYTISHLTQLLGSSDVVPVVNQVEFSPYLYQKDLLEFCDKNKIQLEAYAPLTRGKMFNDVKLIEISSKYSKSPAQIMIRWCIQHNLVVLPKSANKEHIIENANVFDFSISEEDMETLNSFNRNLRVSWDPTDQL